MGRLELRREGHFLDGKIVEQNAELELQLRGAQWVRGRYQWSGLAARWPGLRVELGGPWEKSPDAHCPAAVMAMNPDAILRWPEAGEQRRAA